MSACVEHCNFKTIDNNFSQNLSVSERSSKTSCNTSQRWKTLRQIKIWISRSKQRKALSNLDERLLTDIGLTAEQVKLESNKSFWK